MVAARPLRVRRRISLTSVSTRSAASAGVSWSSRATRRTNSFFFICLECRDARAGGPGRGAGVGEEVARDERDGRRGKNRGAL